MDSYDVLIIGGGGAGFTAAIYTSRAKLKTLLLEKLTPGGQIALTDVVENYPGFPEGVTGADISQRMEEQAKKYGTQIGYEEVTSIAKKGERFEAATNKGSHSAKAVILAAGASFRTLGVPREKELTGRGVSYCATCDGAFFKGKNIIVIGGGDSALQEGLFLTRFVNHLDVVHRRDQLRASPILQERARENSKIGFIWDTVVTAIEGDQKVKGVRLKNVKTGKERPYPTDGVFVFIGHDPSTGFLKNFVAFDDKGYVKTDERLRTSVLGVFAAGEVRSGAVKQLVSACGEGCEAALEAQAYLEQLELAAHTKGGGG
ncbi:MAG: thioredoxin-disulfide reductase [Omnitrophica bacterium RIFCSPLOWO2_01_FULL_50_24]|nr:MAG: thioredoxin-disulfide reductase [Omnitrophica bacterium RIFCSPLOWO2_01_FULL_50_24]